VNWIKGKGVIQKVCSCVRDAISKIGSGSSIFISGFGSAGMPDRLVNALIEQGARDLTIISNNAGTGEEGIAALFREGLVRKIVCSFPRQRDSHHFDRRFRSGEVELELVPQGTLAARIQAAGAGLGAVFTPTAFGTELGEGKETRNISGKDYVLEYALSADFALIKAAKADRLGNLVYNKTARNFGPIMAAAGLFTIAEADEIVPCGALDPENIVTPGIFVQSVYFASENVG